MFTYGLYSTDENEIRYVGKTNNLNKRLYEHIKDSQRNNKTHKQKWVCKEMNNNNEINIKILEECDDAIWEEREKYWISYYNNLINHTDGGEGGHGRLYHISYDETKEIIGKLDIKSGNEWYNKLKNNKIPSFIPGNPRQYFKDKGWISWGIF
jgi:hypothetical protein